MTKPKYASRREFLLRASQSEYDDQWSECELVREAVECDELEVERGSRWDEEETDEADEYLELCELVVTFGLEPSWFPFAPDEGEDA
jgi:hypothetical protein